MFPIRQVSRIELAFPANVDGMLPPYREIGEYPRKQKLEHVVTRWFYDGLKGLKCKPLEGVDETKALAHLSYCLRSWEPKHEHKIAGVAWLINEWFEEFNGA